MRNHPDTLDGRFEAVFFEPNGAQKQVPRSAVVSLPNGDSVSWVAMLAYAPDDPDLRSPIIVCYWPCGGTIIHIAIRSLSKLLVDHGGKLTKVPPEPKDPLKGIYHPGLEVTLTYGLNADGLRTGPALYGGRAQDKTTVRIFNNPGLGDVTHSDPSKSPYSRRAQFAELMAVRGLTEVIIDHALATTSHP